VPTTVQPADTTNDAPTERTDGHNKSVQAGNKAMIETVIALLTTKTLSDAARKLGVSRNTVYERKEKWDIDGLISEMPMQALQALKGSSLKAAMNMIEDLDSYRPKIRQDASKYILDKAIPQPSSQVNIQNNISYRPPSLYRPPVQRTTVRTNDITNDAPKGGENNESNP
jgi:hypothetical protein